MLVTVLSRSVLPACYILVALIILPTFLLPATAAQSTGRARLVLIFVIDGLRPDTINPQDTPHLDRLRRDGVHYLNSHAVFPTVTRVNAAALATGTYPGTNGLVSNSMFVPAVNPTAPFNTGDSRQLLKLNEVSRGRLLFVKSLAEWLGERGLRFAAVSSGSTGSALLLNHRAPQGVGVLVNGNLEPGQRVAYPDAVNTQILSRFGKPPEQGGSALVDWTDKVLRDYVLPELKPDVAIDWQTEPDAAQHEHGVGSPAARAALQNCDRNIGLTIKRLEELGLADQTDIFVLSDHGFSLHTYGVNVTQELIRAGLKASQASDDVVVVSNGQSVLLHVKGRDVQRIKQVVRYLQAQDWVDVIFTSALKPASRTRNSGRGQAFGGQALPEQGGVEGTFSLELIYEANEERGPDVLFTLPWRSSPNQFGVAGTQYIATGDATGPLAGARSGHGGMSPWAVRNTMIAWGVDFKRGIAVRAPASNVDIAPTVLMLKGVRVNGPLDGRVLTEALRDGPDEEQVIATTRILTTAGRGGYRAALQLSEVGRGRYIDKSWRIR